MQKADLSHMVCEVGNEPRVPASSLLFILLVLSQRVLFLLASAPVSLPLL